MRKYLQYYFMEKIISGGGGRFKHRVIITYNRMMSITVLPDLEN